MAPASLVKRRCASLKYAGTVTTALVTLQSSAISAVCFIFSSTMAEICSGKYLFSLVPPLAPGTSTEITGLPPSPSVTGKGICLISSVQSLKWRPMMRLMLNSVRCVLDAAWRLAESPTMRVSSVNATHDAVVRSPSELASTSASPLRHTATHEYVVPRSIPIMCSLGSKLTPATSCASLSALALATAASTAARLAATTSASPSLSAAFPGSSARPALYTRCASARLP